MPRYNSNNVENGIKHLIINRSISKTCDVDACLSCLIDAAQMGAHSIHKK